MAKKPIVAALGAPSKYRPEYCDMLIAHMTEGFSFESFAGKISVCRDTLYEWAKCDAEGKPLIHAAFSDAKKIAAEKCLLYWEKQGIDGLWTTEQKSDDGYTTTKKLNATVWLFNMKNRHGWRDNKDVNLQKEITVVNKVKEELKQKSTEELLEIVQKAKGE